MPEQPRLVNVGDIVWFGISPRQGSSNAGLEPLPAIVTRIMESTDSRSKVTLQVFGGPNAGGNPLYEAVYSDTLKPGFWSWPTPH